jgi:RNA-binding protein
MNKEKILQLRKQAHHLKPIILIGQKGLTEAVLTETNIALDAHECIKIKIGGCERDERPEIINQICQSLKAELIDTIGHIAVIYRKNEQTKS